MEIVRMDNAGHCDIVSFSLKIAMDSSSIEIEKNKFLIAHQVMSASFSQISAKCINQPGFQKA